jgi:hypothetical protein
MAQCERLSGCPFFNDKMTGMPQTTESFKEKYCRNRYSACARYMVLKALGAERVPIDLYPNMRGRAKEIIAKG